MSTIQIDVTDDHVTVVSVPVTCPRCRSALQVVARDDPRGYKVRERRISVECAGHGCTWSGVLVVELVDLGSRRGL